jgi:hypothetical protein
MDLSLVQSYGIRLYTNFMAYYSVFSRHQQHERCRKFRNADNGADVSWVIKFYVELDFQNYEYFYFFVCDGITGLSIFKHPKDKSCRL